MPPRNGQGDTATADASRPVARHTFDWGDVAPSVAVTECVARAAGRAPTEIGPLYEHVDSDALDGLFASPTTPGRGEHLTASFRFREFDVTVHASGLVELRRSNTPS